MKNKTMYYTVSAIFWFLVGLVCHQLYMLPKSERETEKNLMTSANEIHHLYNLGLDEFDVLRKRDYSYDIVRSYSYERDKKILDTIAMVESMVDSLNKIQKVNFSDVDLLFYRRYYNNEDAEIDNLKSISSDENFYNQSDLYGLLYKNTLLTTLRGQNTNRLYLIVSSCNFGRGMFDYLKLFDKNKIGITDYAWYYSIAHCNYPKTKSTSFEFETVIEKLGRNPQIIRTRYKTTPKGEKLGVYDYEKIETIIEK